MKSYRTTYKGTSFRSRLEATWACAFDLLGIAWRYEPFDTAGYCPDFLLGEFMLCEVKPLTWLVRDDAPIVEAREKLEGAHTPYRLALLGLDFAACEWRVSGDWLPMPLRWELGAGDLFAELGTVRGSRPLRFVGTNDPRRIWALAASRVQWKPKLNRPISRRETR